MTQQRDLFTKRWRKVPEWDPLEQDIQKSLVERLEWHGRPDVVWWHTPNGGHRFKITAALLKALGVIPGVPDLIFIWPQLVSIVGVAEVQTMPRVLGLELKASGRKPTSDQHAFAARLRRVGAAYEVADTIDDAIDILKRYELLR